MFFRSQVTVADVRDGSSNTFLAGEKYLPPDSYTTGKDFGDTWSMFEGHHDNVVRWCDPRLLSVCQPRQDIVGDTVYTHTEFGSAHADSFNMAFCDGSVRAIGYTIDVTTCGRLANRADGQVIDAKGF